MESETTNGANAAPTGRSKAGKVQGPVRRLFGLTWYHRTRCFVVLFWEVTIQAAALGGFLYGGVALDILRYEASPDAAQRPRWPLGLEPAADRPLWVALGAASLFVIGLTVIRTIARYFARYTGEQLIQAVTVAMRSSLYDKIQRMGFTFFDTHDSGGLINRVTGDTASVRMFVQGIVVRMLVSVATFALFFSFMISAHWGLTLAVLGVFPIQGWLLLRYNRRIEPKLRTDREATDRMIQNLQESIAGIRVIKGFGQAAQVIAAFGRRIDECVRARLDIEKTSGTMMPLIAALSYVQLAVLVSYGSWLVIQGPAAGGIALGTLWVFLGLTQQLSAQLESLITSAASIPETLVGAGRVFELLDAPIPIQSPSKAAKPTQVRGTIEFDAVTFRYQPHLPDVLNDLSFTVEAGETVAMVGPAGGGKSTILDLVGRFYDVTTGSVLVDGVDVRDWDLDALRKHLGVVFQDPFLFSNTIENNVRFGVPDADRTTVMKAVDAAAASEFVNAAPGGLETLIGERGLTLSGGERQRLTLARALIPEPSILLLDDAMSAVDARTEAQIQQSLDVIMRQRTTLIVSHRLGTWRHADRILVIEGGRLVAQGTHDELIATNAYYQRSASLQLELHELEDDVRAGGASFVSIRKGDDGGEN